MFVRVDSFKRVMVVLTLQVMSSESRSMSVPSSGTTEYKVVTSLELESSSDCGMGLALETADRIASAAKEILKKLWTAILIME